MDDLTQQTTEVYEAPVIESVLETGDIEREIVYAGSISFLPG
jgi:hypothetical protein